MTSSILLTGYDAKRCARRVHNERDPSVEQVEWEVPADLQMRFDVGKEFESAIFDELKTCLGPERCVDLRDHAGKQARVAATVRAMGDETEVILDGWLPDDVAGARSGRPDVLLHMGQGTYAPGDVKAHKTVTASARGRLRYSTFATPHQQTEVPGRAAQTTTRLDDYLQLAHYWRMLESLGAAPNDGPCGFIIGTDDLPELSSTGRVLTWLRLDEPVFATYSRSRGKAERSALERYDHEHGFRLDVARAAVAGEPALVQPIFTDECNACPWYDYCLAVTGDDVASAHITSGRLSVREWRALATAGIVTVGDLAGLDPHDPAFAQTYLPEVSHQREPLGRLEDAVRRARMIEAGRTLERQTEGPIEVPRADIEIDLDIEWDPADRVYLWGALVTRPDQEPTYRPFVSFDEMEHEGAVDLAETLASWLRGEIQIAEAEGRSLRVYHYSHPEPSYLKRLLGEADVAVLLERFVDLHSVIAKHYFGLHGLGIKRVAPAFGFEWRDEEPGGLQSQLWLQEARAGDEATRSASRERILAYNEDDVRATYVIRRALSEGRTPR